MAATAKIGTPKPVAQRAITVTRVYDAPRKLVFGLWTDAKHLAKWWGPHGWTNPRCEADPRPGGKILIHMQAPDGTAHPMGGIYREIVPHERIVLETFVDGPNGRILDVYSTVTFEDVRGRTKLTLHADAQGFADFAARMLAGMEAGWSQSLDKLAGLAAQQNGNPDAADQIAIRAMFGDRTNALFGKVADLAVKHLAADIVSYDLAPPLQQVGIDKAAIQKWFDTWDGPIGWAMGDLEVQIGGDVAFAYGLGHMTGTKTDGAKADLWTRVTVGLTRRGGTWKVVHEHASVPFLMDGSFKAAVDLKP
jgi:PhnB protein